MKERKLKETSIINNKIDIIDNNNNNDDTNIKLKNAIFDLKNKANAPLYSADSPYILTGFRQPLNVIDCIKSIFKMHNQTFNIWTALILVGYNLYLGYHFTINENMSSSILTFFWIHSILRSICWINSFLYHTFVCYSKDIANLLCTLDYIGCYLTPLGMGSNFIYLQYYCNPIFAYIIIPIGFIIITIAIILSMLPFYQKEEYRKIRAVITLISIMPYIIGN
jgi:adiponectin receptor